MINTPDFNPCPGNFNQSGYNPAAIGTWIPADNDRNKCLDLHTALLQFRSPVYICRDNTGSLSIQTDGTAMLGQSCRSLDDPAALEVLAYAPPLAPEQCGDMAFTASHNLKYAVVAGSMAKGISSAAMVAQMGKAGMLGFLGSAGLEVAEVENKLRWLEGELGAGKHTYGCNLIHSPHEPELEQHLTDLYLRLNVHLIEASAFLRITPPLVEYRLHGIHRNTAGEIVTPNKIIAKISREEIAAHFLSPAPEKIVAALLAAGKINAEQAELARHIPMAEDITAEADSGGHTDNRPAMALFPTIVALRDTLHRQYQYAVKPRVGLGGGIATPYAAAAAFAMGAAYIVTGSINQSCVEAGTSDVVKTMLAEARQADIAMAPAADMFEMGVDVQVLKRGTMFSMRASALYNLYRKYASIEEIPAEERAKLEKSYFKTSLDEVWNSTAAFFSTRDPRQIERAHRDPKHKMALMFRAYLGQATHWAIAGDPQRKVDYQIWCGPAMAAFNAWVKGTFLEQAQHREVVCVNFNVLVGATIWLRAQMLGQARNMYEAVVPERQIVLQPLTNEQIRECLG